MGGGKSFLLRWAALLYLCFLYKKTGIKNIPVGLFSEDYPTLKDRQLSRIIREFPPELGELRDSKSEGNCFFLNDNLGGGRILLRNLDDPSKYMSTEFAGEFVEELTRNQEQTFMDLRNRLRYPGVDEVKFMGASNPGGVGHGWVKKLFIDHNTPDIEQNRFFYIHANAYDNQFISPEYIKQLESLPSQQRKAYLEGSWDVFAGQFFTEWGQRHIINPFVPKDQIIVGGMDWGRAKPFSFHLATVDKVFWQNEENESEPFYRVKTFFEVYGVEKDPSEWGNLIKEELANRFSLTLNDIEWVQCDPTIFNKGNDNGVSIADQFIESDERWRLLKPAKNDRIQGWTIVHKWLSNAPDGVPFYQVASNCKNLIRTLPELVHDENIIEDVDSGGEDHCLKGDTLIYTTEGKKRIEDLVGKEGYLYSIGSGINNFFNVRKTGISQVYRVIFENGLYVDATSLHPFLSESGRWIPTNRLTSHDVIQCLYEDYCTIKNEAKFQRIKLLQVRILLQQTIQKVQWLKKIAQRSLDISFWRNTKGISCPSQRPKSGQQSNRKFRIIEIILSFISSFSNSRSKRKSKNKPKIICSTESCPMAQIKRGISLAQNSRTTQAIKVKKIIKLGIFPVYNLEVENTQCFAVNGGILVHNSPDDQRYMLRAVKLMEGFTGQIKSKKYREQPTDEQNKFFQDNESTDAFLVDIDKFK